MSHSFRKDKVVLVTGSSKGLGKATAIYLAKKGAKVVINGRDKKTLHQVTNEIDDENIELIAMQGDVTKAHECEDLIRSVVKTYKKLDCVINNAGITSQSSLDDSDLEIIETSINTNLMSAIYCSKYAIPHLKATKGSIVFISSLGGIRGIPNLSTYCAAKMGLRAFRQSIQGELKRHQIHCGVVFSDHIKCHENKSIDSSEEKKIDAPETPAQNLEFIAKQIAKLIQKRRYSKVIGLRSKVFVAFSTFFPGLLDWMLRKNVPSQSIAKDIDLLSTEE